MAAPEPTGRAQSYFAMLTDIEQELGVAPRRNGLRRRQATFLACYEGAFSITAAATAADIGRQQVYRWAAEDPVYERAWTEAQQSVADAVLGEVFRRAVEGQEVVVRDRHGTEVATERRPSDRLLLALAKALDPERFGGRPPERKPKEETWRAAMHRIMADPEAVIAMDRIADMLVMGQQGDPQAS